MSNIKLQFYGATQTVTGSCFKLDIKNGSYLIDCGMFQGVDVQDNNYIDFQFDPSSIKAVFLSHAHLDHCGLLPKLVKKGFSGKIYLTHQTSELVKIILKDSAKLQELREKMGQSDLPMIYNSIDVEKAISQFQTVNYYEEINLTSDVKFVFIPTGHILGSVNVLIKINDESILFSGDIGRRVQSIIKRFSDYNNKIFQPNYIIMESLYGGKIHSNRDENMSRLVKIINESASHNRTIIIPVFALHRAQELLELLKIFFVRGLIDKKIQVFLDSPMAIDITEIYKNNMQEFNDHYHIIDRDIIYSNEQKDLSIIANNHDRFDFEQLKSVRKSKKSQRIGYNKSAIILAGSGMADGGRVVRHIQNVIEDSNNSIVFVGYQAENTLGRQLVDGASKVEINGKILQVKAKIEYLRGFSAHADNDDLLAWLFNYDLTRLQRVFLVHADVDRASVFKEILASKNIAAYIPKLGEEYII